MSSGVFQAQAGVSLPFYYYDAFLGLSETHPLADSVKTLVPTAPVGAQRLQGSIQLKVISQLGLDAPHVRWRAR